MSEAISSILLLSGCAFLFLAALGILRMPDLFTRMQAGTKASTLGVALALMGLAVHFQRLDIWTLASAGIAFFLLTAPVAAHMISRAAYFVGVPLWERTIVDELQGRYDPETHRLADPATPASVQSVPPQVARDQGGADAGREELT